jgi:acetyl-CoA carboxylase beta subunit
MTPELKHALMSILIGTLTALFTAIIQQLTNYLHTLPAPGVGGVVAAYAYLRNYL